MPTESHDYLPPVPRAGGDWSIPLAKRYFVVSAAALVISLILVSTIDAEANEWLGVASLAATIGSIFCFLCSLFLLEKDRQLRLSAHAWKHGEVFAGIVRRTEEFSPVIAHAFRRSIALGIGAIIAGSAGIAAADLDAQGTLLLIGLLVITVLGIALPVFLAYRSLEPQHAPNVFESVNVYVTISENGRDRKRLARSWGLVVPPKGSEVDVLKTPKGKYYFLADGVEPRQ